MRDKSKPSNTMKEGANEKANMQSAKLFRVGSNDGVTLATSGLKRSKGKLRVEEW